MSVGNEEENDALPTYEEAGGNAMNDERKKSKEYKIYYLVNILTDENDRDRINNKDALRPLLSSLFDTKTEEDVFNIKTTKKGGGFGIEFGITSWRNLDEASMKMLRLKEDGLFQTAVKDAFNMDETPDIHNWQARFYPNGNEGSCCIIL